MNRILTLLIVLLVLGIALSRTNDILIALSPYDAMDSGDAPTAVIEEELAGRPME